MIVINESGLYDMIFDSRLPKAKEFRHWVTCDVIIDDEQCPIRIIKLIFTYSNLRIEHKETVKVLIGKNDYELYKQYFGEVEEA